MEMKSRVKMLMEEKNMNQKQLAKAAGITEASMSKYLSGERTPRIDIIVNIARALEVTVDDLIGNDVDENVMNLARFKLVLARGMGHMSEEDKKELIKFLLEK